MQNVDVNKSEITKKITPVIEKAAEESGLILLEANFVKDGGKWHLRVFIYNSETQVTHENCQTIAKKIDQQLDEVIPVPYYLEVSSPGAERKLKSEKEYEIFRGERVKIKVKKNVEREEKTFFAIIKDYTEEDGLTVELIGEEGILKLKKADVSYIKLAPEYNF